MPESENTAERTGTPVRASGDAVEACRGASCTSRSTATDADPRTAEKLDRLAAGICRDAVHQPADYVLRHNTSHDGE